MTRLLLAGAGALAFGFVAVPASATITIGSPCTSVLQADGGCVFNGNDGPPSADATIMTVYNASGKAGAPITLNRILKYDASRADFGTTVTLPGFGTITFAADGKSGTWNLPGFTVDFISAKGGTQFKLTKLTTAGSSGTWDTTGLTVGQGGQQPALSHIIFYGGGGVVPEPATWAMLIAGFGLVGGALRRRRETVAHVSA